MSHSYNKALGWSIALAFWCVALSLGVCHYSTSLALVCGTQFGCLAPLSWVCGTSFRLPLFIQIWYNRS